jgi:hypothetical protein
MVNPAGFMMAAAAMAAAERKVLDAFRTADATAPGRARRLDDIGLPRDGAFERLTAAGVLREAGPGEFYLDEAALIARRDVKPTRALWAIGLALTALLLIAVAALLLTRP